MMFKIVSAIVSLLFICVCHANGSLSPSQIVQEYCELDARGVRLSSATYPEIGRLMAWDDGRGEPGWDTFKVIANFKVLKEEISGQTAKVTVQYQVLADIVDGSLKENRITETVLFQLKRKAAGWKIENYVPYPHLYVSAAIETIRSINPASDVLKKLEIKESTGSY